VINKLLQNLMNILPSKKVQHSEEHSEIKGGKNSAPNLYYSRQLTPSEIEAGEHRAFVGGLWEEIGQLQFDFMKSNGLLPHHTLIDIGCGAMRGGIHFVNYLDRRNYFGLDINNSVIEAGKNELDMAGLLIKEPHLLVNDTFELSLFNVEFDYAIAVSVFTHLYLNNILRCLAEVSKTLKRDGMFFATFFEAPTPAYRHAIEHKPGGMVTHYDKDPFHYSLAEMQMLARLVGLKAERREWSHPRNQKILCFTHSTRPDFIIS
jgi:SAM-dependent methyltransferase